MIKIHFVCTGNAFRSRLAEAYLKSKEMPDVSVSSSGIEAQKNINGFMCRYTLTLAKADEIEDYLSKNWTVTTKAEIESQDKVIFMKKEHYLFCLKTLNCKLPAYEIWEIEDVYDLNSSPKPDELIKIATPIYEKIKDKVDLLSFSS